MTKNDAKLKLNDRQLFYLCSECLLRIILQFTTCTRVLIKNSDQLHLRRCFKLFENEPNLKFKQNDPMFTR